MEQRDEKWSTRQISQASGLSVPGLHRRRRLFGIPRRPDGYTLEEALKMACYTVADEETLANCKGRKTLRLHALMKREAQPF